MKSAATIARKQAGKIMDLALDFLWPRDCLLCELPSRTDRDLCQYCQAALPLNAHPCIQCGLPAQTTTSPEDLQTQPSDIVCAACIAKPPPFDRTVAPMLYKDFARHLITRAKYQKGYRQAQVLGQTLADAVRATTRTGNLVLPQAILPMPLAWQRTLRRGYNQATLIAAPLSPALGIPTRHNILRRTRHTAPQQSLSRSQRLTNLNGAFEVRAANVDRPLPSSVAVVDDVMTTGSTVTAAARVLRAAGIKHIQVWVVARALG